MYYRSPVRPLTVLGGVLLRLAGVHNQCVQIATLDVRSVFARILQHQILGNVQLLNQIDRRRRLIGRRCCRCRRRCGWTFVAAAVVGVLMVWGDMDDVSHRLGNATVQLNYNYFVTTYHYGQ